MEGRREGGAGREVHAGERDGEEREGIWLMRGRKRRKKGRQDGREGKGCTLYLYNIHTLQIIFHAEVSRFTLDDGFQEPVVLVSPHRDILAATFHKFVLKNIGGSEKFQDKQNFFYSKLKEHHNRQSRNDKRVVVNRDNLLESVRKITVDPQSCNFHG